MNIEKLQPVYKAGTLTLHLYDEIGPNWANMIDDPLVNAALLAYPNADTVNVRINSPGGDVFAGLSIFNLLRRQSAHIIVDVDGLAASAASIIAMAADKLRMSSNAMLMIHYAWTIVAGNSKELRKTADVLDNIGNALRATYAARTGLSNAEIHKLLDAETWFTATDAVAKGFADEIDRPFSGAFATIADGRYRNTPKSLLDPARRISSLDETIARIAEVTARIDLTPARTAAEQRIKKLRDSLAV